MRQLPAIPEFEQFRGLDKAPESLLHNQTLQIAANARMEQIMATNPNPLREPKRKPVTKKQLAFRLATIPALAAGLIAASVFAPSGSSIGPAPAFATWTSTPSALVGERLDLATNACITSLNTSINEANNHTMQFPGLPTHTTPLVAEQRGDWALVVLGDAEPETLFGRCLVLFVNGAPKVLNFFATIGNNSLNGVPTSGEFDFFEGEWETGMLHQTSIFWHSLPAADGTATLVTALDAELRDNGEFSVLTGRVGSDVIGLTFHTNAGIDVAATVTNGEFAAWWPASAGMERPDFDYFTGWTDGAVGRFATGVTLTLADGTVLANQPVQTYQLRGMATFS